MHSKRKFELATVRRAEIIEGVLELEFVSGKIETFGFGFGLVSTFVASFFVALEKSLPVPLQKDTFLKHFVCHLGDKSKTLVPAEWQSRMSSAIGREIALFPIKEVWSALFGRKLTTLSTALFTLACVALPVLTSKQVPVIAYLTLLIPLGIATWLVVRKKVSTLDLVIGQDGLGVALSKRLSLASPTARLSRSLSRPVTAT
jgi:hypothetical protein